MSSQNKFRGRMNFFGHFDRRESARRGIRIGGPRGVFRARTRGEIGNLGARLVTRRRAWLVRTGRRSDRRRPSGVRRDGALSRSTRARVGGKIAARRWQ